MSKETPRAATKSTIFQTLAEKTELSRKQVAAVFEQLEDYIRKELSKKGPGVFQLPGLLKIMKVQKQATKARMGTKPGTNEPMMYKAKPARTIVKVRPLKALKEMV